MLVLFKTLTEKDKSAAIDHLIKGSTPSQDFFFMIILSVITATFGLLFDNVAVIIGSMLIAPILYPILSLSLGITMSDNKLISRAFYTLAKATALGIATAFVITFFFSGNFAEHNNEITSRTIATLPFFIVALTAGTAGSFALVKPQLNETLPGIAISVALIPPLSVVGIGVAKFNSAIVSGAFLLFLVNIVGIVFSGMVVFSLMNFYVKRKEAHELAQKEDVKIKAEFTKVKKVLEESS